MQDGAEDAKGVPLVNGRKPQRFMPFSQGSTGLRRPDPGPLEPVNHTGAALRQLLLPAGPRGATRQACPLRHVQFAAQLYPVSIDIR